MERKDVKDRQVIEIKSEDIKLFGVGGRVKQLLIIHPKYQTYH